MYSTKTKVSFNIEMLEQRTLLTNTAGTLDPNFGVAGLGQFTAPTGVQFKPAGIAVEPTNEIIEAFSDSRYPADVAIEHFSPFGDPAYSFGVLGETEAKVVGAATSVTPVGVGIQSNGKIVVAGTAYFGGGNSRFFVARFNSDGTFDTTFAYGGSDSSVFLSGSNITEMDVATAMKILPDDSIAVVGYRESPYYGGVEKYDSDGRLQTSFGNSGIALVPNSTYALSVDCMSNGSLFVGGYAGISGFVASFSSGGSVNSGFGADGITTLQGSPQGGIENFTMSLAADSTRDRVVAGFLKVTLGNNFSSVVIAYNALNGEQDDTFGTGGQAVLPTAMSYPDGMVLQSDGSVVIDGPNYANGDAAVIARLTPAGKLDSQFGNGGSTALNFPYLAQPLTLTTTGAYASIALDGDGHILIAGQAASYSTPNDVSLPIARLLPGEYPQYINGNPPTAPGSVAATQFDNGGFDVAYRADYGGMNEGAYDDGQASPDRASGVANEHGYVDFTHAKDWVSYTLNVQDSGYYQVVMHGHSPFTSGSEFRIKFVDNGSFVETSEVSPPLTDSDFTVGTVRLAAGTAKMTIDFDVNNPSGFVVDYSQLDFTLVSPPTIASLTTTDKKVTVGATADFFANDVVDPQGNLTSVSFYLETNSKPGLQVGSDQFIGYGLIDPVFFGNNVLEQFSTTGLAPETYEVYAQALDGDQLLSKVAATHFQVLPLPSLTVTPPANQSAVAGVNQSFSLGSFSEINATSPFSIVVNWGDGSAATTLSKKVAGEIPLVHHKFAAKGSDTVTVTVTDANGVTSKASFNVTVNGAPSPAAVTVGGDLNLSANNVADPVVQSISRPLVRLLSSPVYRSPRLL
jgi:uncharacterized delta-60 repeat protein